MGALRRNRHTLVFGESHCPLSGGPQIVYPIIGKLSAARFFRRVGRPALRRPPPGRSRRRRNGARRDEKGIDRIKGRGLEFLSDSLGWDLDRGQVQSLASRILAVATVGVELWLGRQPDPALAFGFVV